MSWLSRSLAALVLCCGFLFNLGCTGLSAARSASGSPISPAPSPPPAPTPLSISGTITPASSSAGAMVALSGAASATATIDNSGNYTFGGLANGSYTLTPSKTGLTFSPSNRQVAASGSNVGGVNFSAASASQTSGPISINGQTGVLIQGLVISSTSGNCVTITNSTNVTIQNSQIGPCGGNGVAISGGSGINIYDSYIHPETQATSCCDHNDGIYAAGTQNLAIQGNVIAYGEDNIQIDTTTGATITGNFLLNPRNYASNGARGHQFQAWKNSANVTASNNYTVSSSDTSVYLYPGAVQDAISFGQTTTFSATGNFVTGGQSFSGCALIADTATKNGSFTSNLVLDSGNCGIEIASGFNNAMEQNKVLLQNPVENAQMPVALSVWGSYVSTTGETCSYGTVVNNVAAAQQLDGSYENALFAPASGADSCSPLTNSGNTLNTAAVTLMTSPSIGAVFPIPSIPPQPQSCVATSPYSTATGAPACVP